MSSSSKLSERQQIFFDSMSVSTKDTLLYYTDAVASVNWINVEHWNRVMVILFRVKGTGSIQESEIQVATDVNGAGAISLSTSGSTEATGLLTTAGKYAASNDATGNRGTGMIVHDINVSDLDSTLAGGKYLAVRLSQATGADRMAVCWILSDPRYGQSGFTSTGRGSTTPGVV